jgi:hypothetical protein
MQLVKNCWQTISGFRVRNPEMTYDTIGRGALRIRRPAAAWTRALP